MLTEINKREDKNRIKTTNCFDCGLELDRGTAKQNPNGEGDTRFFCPVDYKKRFGKKKKLIKRT